MAIQMKIMSDVAHDNSDMKIMSDVAHGNSDEDYVRWQFRKDKIIYRVPKEAFNVYNDPFKTVAVTAGFNQISHKGKHYVSDFSS